MYRYSRPRSLARAVAVLTVAAVLLVGSAQSALAHDPIFITDDQMTPDTGPYMPDGSISWALYGSVIEAGDTRGFEFDLRDGDEVFVSLLIPNLSPEVDLGDGELPTIELEAPDGSVVTIAPEIREVFDEPFSNTSYVTLAEYRVPAQAGRYRGLLVGNAPARFSVAIGETEIFFTETERSGDRPSSFADITGPLTLWYTTPPGGEPDSAALQDGEAEIQLDLIEEAMELGEAEAPAASLETEVDEDAMVEDAAVSAEDSEQERAPVDEAESDTASESAAALVAEQSGSSPTWVAPAVIAALVVVGSGTYLATRRKA